MIEINTAEDFTKLIEENLGLISPMERAEIAVNITVSGLCANPEMEPSQKADLMMSALSFYRLAIVSEFMHELCTLEKGAKDYGLLLGSHDDLDALKMIRARLTGAVIMLEDEKRKAITRFQTLGEMLAPAKEEASVA